MRDYPAFIIDRSRRSAASRFTDDFIVCPDKEVGFIARVYTVRQSRRAEFEQMLGALSAQERDNKYYVVSIGTAIAVLEVVRMLYEPVAHINRLRPLMKKAMKAYLYGEVKEVAGEGAPYDLQIGAVKDVLRTMQAQYDSMVDANGKEATDRLIKAMRGAAESLEWLKKITRTEQ